MLMTDLKINPQFENLLPPLTDEEFLGLQDGVVKHKGRTDRDPLDDPIHVWSKGNFIIDGHNRYKILIANGMTTNNISVHNEFDTESQVMQWIRDHQSNRRNLKRSELVRINIKIEEQVAREAKERYDESAKKFHGNQYTSGAESNLTQDQTIKETGRTAEIMAKKSGFGSKNTWSDAKLIVQEGSKEKINRMDKGGKGNGISAIAQEIREGIPDGYRRCRCCKKIKPLSDFNKEGQNGYKTYCKECTNERRRETYKKVSAIKKEEALKDFNSRESLMRRQFGERTKYTLDMYINELKSNMNNTIGTIQFIINAHAGEFTDTESVMAINSLFETFINKVTKLKERSANGSDQEEESAEQRESGNERESVSAS